MTVLDEILQEIDATILLREEEALKGGIPIERGLFLTGKASGLNEAYRIVQKRKEPKP